MKKEAYISFLTGCKWWLCCLTDSNFVFIQLRCKKRTSFCIGLEGGDKKRRKKDWYCQVFALLMYQNIIFLFLLWAIPFMLAAQVYLTTCYHQKKAKNQYWIHSLYFANTWLLHYPHKMTKQTKTVERNLLLWLNILKGLFTKLGRITWPAINIK